MSHIMVACLAILRYIAVTEYKPLCSYNSAHRKQFFLAQLDPSILLDRNEAFGFIGDNYQVNSQQM